MEWATLRDGTRRLIGIMDNKGAWVQAPLVSLPSWTLPSEATPKTLINSSYFLALPQPNLAVTFCFQEIQPPVARAWHVYIVLHTYRRFANAVQLILDFQNFLS